MDYYVFLNVPGENQTVYQVPSDGLRIGRGEDQSICISDREISRSHFQLSFIGEKLFGRDEGSRNGTFINGTLIDRGRDVLVEAWDEIRIGKTLITVSDQPVLEEHVFSKTRLSAGKTLDTILSDVTPEEGIMLQKEMPLFLEMIEKLQASASEKVVIHQLNKTACSWLEASESHVIASDDVMFPLSSNQTVELYSDLSNVAEKSNGHWNVCSWSSSKQQNIHSFIRTLIKGVMLLVEGPFDMSFLQRERMKLFHLVIDQAQGKIHALRQSAKIRAQQEQKAFPWRLEGKSSFMNSLRCWVNQVSEVDSTVLITGETGTGKEMVARGIHFQSNRASKPFVVVNCAAIPRELMESELFGHEKGAFTGANCRRIGRFEQAHSGTLFLDEIGELDMKSQNKLLRVLEERVFERVGGSVPISVDVRILAATNRNLAEERAKSRFRDDLFYRLNVMAMNIIPLTERPEDIVCLSELFVREIAASLARHPVRISSDVMKYLQKYDWPGNVRELKNVIERALVLCKGNILKCSDLPQDIAFPSTSLQLEDDTLSGARDLFEQDYILSKIRHTRGNVSEAARNAGISRQAFHDLLKKHRIDPGVFRA